MGRLALRKGRGEGEGLPLDKSISANARPLTLVLSPSPRGEAFHYALVSPATDNQRTLPLLHRDPVWWLDPELHLDELFSTRPASET
jgi:hypothetical protein